MRGRIKWYDSTKGFGFINTEEGSDVFLHYSYSNTTNEGYEIFDEGDEVEFEIAEGRRGPHAINVIRIDE